MEFVNSTSLNPVDGFLRVTSTPVTAAPDLSVTWPVMPETSWPKLAGRRNIIEKPNTMAITAICNRIFLTELLQKVRRDRKAPTGYSSIRVFCFASRVGSVTDLQLKYEKAYSLKNGRDDVNLHLLTCKIGRASCRERVE